MIGKENISDMPIDPGVAVQTRFTLERAVHVVLSRQRPPPSSDITHLSVTEPVSDFINNYYIIVLKLNFISKFYYLLYLVRSNIPL